MFELVVIDHSFVEPSNRKRWKLLAKRHPVKVTLLVPSKWESEWLRERVTYRPERVVKQNFEVVPIPTTTNSNWSKYFFLSIDTKLRSLDPDIIHIQHSEMSLIHHQIIPYKRLWASDADITFFSMNALGVRQEKWHQRLRWQHLKRNVTAALCHYPGCRHSLRKADFEKPIYQQTSYGVDEDIFYPDTDDRLSMRRELGFSDSFLIGYVGRLTSDKGIDDLLEALPLNDINWSLLLVGDGEMREEINQIVKENEWENRVSMTGYVEKEEVARYMRAMDTFVLGSKTQENWIDTFPRSIVEAMASGVPVIGSDSGAIPYQIGNAGLVYPEGDVSTLRSNLHDLAHDKNKREKLGRQGREECVSRFGQRALADNFYKIMKQIRGDMVTYNTEGETNQYNAY